MICRVEIELYGFDGTVEYQFIECNDYAEVRAQFKNNPKVIYIGELLRMSQMNNLKELGNTIISKTMLEKVGKKEILKEVKRLTGLKCEIVTYKSGTIVLRVK